MSDLKSNLIELKTEDKKGSNSLPTKVKEESKALEEHKGKKKPQEKQLLDQKIKFKDDNSSKEKFNDENSKEDKDFDDNSDLLNDKSGYYEEEEENDLIDDGESEKLIVNFKGLSEREGKKGEISIIEDEIDFGSIYSFIIAIHQNPELTLKNLQTRFFRLIHGEGKRKMTTTEGDYKDTFDLINAFFYKKIEKYNIFNVVKKTTSTIKEKKIIMDCVKGEVKCCGCGEIIDKTTKEILYVSNENKEYIFCEKCYNSKDYKEKKNYKETSYLMYCIYCMEHLIDKWSCSTCEMKFKDSDDLYHCFNKNEKLIIENEYNLCSKCYKKESKAEKEKLVRIKDHQKYKCRLCFKYVLQDILYQCSQCENYFVCKKCIKKALEFHKHIFYKYSGERYFKNLLKEGSSLHNYHKLLILFFCFLSFATQFYFMIVFF